MKRAAAVAGVLAMTAMVDVHVNALEACDPTALSAIFARSNTTTCAEDTGYNVSVLAPPTETDANTEDICLNTACQAVLISLFEEFSNECLAGNAANLHEMMLDPISNACLPYWTASSASNPSSAALVDLSDTSTPVATDEPSGDSPGVSVGIVVGIVCGALILGAVIAVVVLHIRRRRQEANKRLATDDDANGGYHRYNDRPSYGNAGTTSSSSQFGSQPQAGSNQRGGANTSASTGSSPLWEDECITSSRIPYEKVVFGKLLSQGGFGEVHQGTYRTQAVAIKTLLPERRRSMRQIELFLSEVKLMASLEHAQIVRFVGVAWDSLNELCVVSELMTNGDLRTTLEHWHEDSERVTGLEDPNKVKIALHVIHALTYMHTLDTPVLHRDLKSRNILLDEELNAKLTDFGISRERADNTMTSGVGSSLWMAPEVMRGERYNEKADVFSFGVVLSELDLHVLPYANATEKGTNRKLPDTAILQMVAMGHLQVEFSSPVSELAQVGMDCVAVDPMVRPSTPVVLNHVHKIWKRYMAIL